MFNNLWQESLVPSVWPGNVSNWWCFSQYRRDAPFSIYTRRWSVFYESVSKCNIICGLFLLKTGLFSCSGKSVDCSFPQHLNRLEKCIPCLWIIFLRFQNRSQCIVILNSYDQHENFIIRCYGQECFYQERMTSYNQFQLGVEEEAVKMVYSSFVGQKHGN